MGRRRLAPATGLRYSLTGPVGPCVALGYNQGMKVRELIELLQRQDPDREALITGLECLYDVSGVETSEEFGGQFTPPDALIITRGLRIY